MKNICDLIKESAYNNEHYKLIISSRGSMNDATGFVKKLIKKFPDVEIFVFDESTQKINPIDDIKDYKAGGPHTDNFDTLADFYNKNQGDPIIFIRN